MNDIPERALKLLQNNGATDSDKLAMLESVSDLRERIEVCFPKKTNSEVVNNTETGGALKFLPLVSRAPLSRI